LASDGNCNHEPLTVFIESSCNDDNFILNDKKPRDYFIIVVESTEIKQIIEIFPAVHYSSEYKKNHCQLKSIFRGDLLSGACT